MSISCLHRRSRLRAARLALARGREPPRRSIRPGYGTGARCGPPPRARREHLAGARRRAASAAAGRRARRRAPCRGSAAARTSSGPARAVLGCVDVGVEARIAPPGRSVATSGARSASTAPVRPRRAAGSGDRRARRRPTPPRSAQRARSRCRSGRARPARRRARARHRPQRARAAAARLDLEVSASQIARASSASASSGDSACAELAALERPVVARRRRARARPGREDAQQREIVLGERRPLARSVAHSTPSALAAPRAAPPRRSPSRSARARARPAKRASRVDVLDEHRLRALERAARDRPRRPRPSSSRRRDRAPWRAATRSRALLVEQQQRGLRRAEHARPRARGRLAGSALASGSLEPRAASSAPRERASALAQRCEARRARSVSSARRTASAQLLLVDRLRQVVARAERAAPRARTPGRRARTATITRSVRPAARAAAASTSSPFRSGSWTSSTTHAEPRVLGELRAPRPAHRQPQRDAGLVERLADHLAEEALVVHHQDARRGSLMALPIGRAASQDVARQVLVPHQRLEPLAHEAPRRSRGRAPARSGASKETSSSSRSSTVCRRRAPMFSVRCVHLARRCSAIARDRVVA